MNFKVSIIVPIYNVEKYIEKCVSSLINQTYKNIEILLVDDCTKDNSGIIAKKFIELDNRCKYIKREKNGGLAAARNTGILNSSGNYLMFVDSDDTVANNFVEVMLNKAIDEKADIVVCDYNMVYDDGEIQCAYPLKCLKDNNNTLNNKVAYIRNHAWTKMFKKDFFINQNLFFPEYIKRGEDMGITIPLLTRTSNISIVDIPLYNYFQRDNSLSNDSSNKIDLKFYDDAIDLMINNSDDKFKDEIEYHIILEMIYGKTMLMIKHKYTDDEIREHLNKWNLKFPNWIDNKYIKNMNKLKRLFVINAFKKNFIILRLMVFINEKRKK